MRVLEARNRNQQESGFNLIEIMVTVSIMLIFLGFVVSFFIHSTTSAKDARARVNIINATQLFNNVISTNGTVTYDPLTRTLYASLGSGNGMSVDVNTAGGNDVSLPETAQVWSRRQQITEATPLTDRTIDLGTFCVQDTGVNTFRIAASDPNRINGVVTGTCAAVAPPLVPQSSTLGALATAPIFDGISSSTIGVPPGYVKRTSFWLPPVDTGGQPVTGYVGKCNTVANPDVGTPTSFPADARQGEFVLPFGTYYCYVAAVTDSGRGSWLAYPEYVMLH